MSDRDLWSRSDLKKENKMRIIRCAASSNVYTTSARRQVSGDRWRQTTAKSSESYQRAPNNHQVGAQHKTVSPSALLSHSVTPKNHEHNTFDKIMSVYMQSYITSINMTQKHEHKHDTKSTSIEMSLNHARNHLTTSINKQIVTLSADLSHSVPPNASRVHEHVII